MVSKQSVEQQLKKIKFNWQAWGKGEAMELPNILLEDETIFECVNGIYEGGFAMLVATDVRLLLIDKKPLNFLTVEDLRFDMINEIDYSHRLLGAHISVSAGNKNLKFTSYNQTRLRKAIGHVQHKMAEGKKEQAGHQVDQKQHLEQINQQLQAYLLAQHQQNEDIKEHYSNSDEATKEKAKYEPVKPSPELSDYLFAQRLLAEHEKQKATQNKDSTEQLPELSTLIAEQVQEAELPEPAAKIALPAETGPKSNDDLLEEGMKEIFGRSAMQMPAQTPIEDTQLKSTTSKSSKLKSFEINPLKIAYSKLPMALRNRRFGRPSFHDHSQNQSVTSQQAIMPN